MSEEDIKNIIAQLNRLEGIVETGFRSLIETDSHFREDIKELFCKIETLSHERPCDNCEPMKQLSVADISRWQIRGIWGALSLIFGKIFWEWWAKK